MLDHPDSEQLVDKGEKMRPTCRVTLLLLLALCCAPLQARALELGAYYFPGWHSKSAYWNDLKGLAGSRSPGRAWPEREPLLGHYPEEEQWVAEQHIEWAAGYGLSFFAYDWYWDGQGVYLNHALERYLSARNKSKLKFSLLWANHYGVPANLGQFSAMVDYWIEHYFKDAMYLRVDGKPVVFIFSPQALRDDAARFGRSTRELFELARAKALAKGLPGIYFVGSAPANSYWVKDYLPGNGYDAISAYNYRSGGFQGAYQGNEPVATSYAELTQGYRDQWQWMLKNSPLPYFVPMSAGWDRRPWGSNSSQDRCSSTPQSFREMLVAARKVLEQNLGKTKGIGIIYAWNELGEGGYIEPTKKWRFQYLEAIKDVFGK